MPERDLVICQGAGRGWLEFPAGSHTAGVRVHSPSGPCGPLEVEGVADSSRASVWRRVLGFCCALDSLSYAA